MMPLIVKDFTWKQTTDEILVTVNVNGIRGSSTSFITAPNYIRLHCHPHYFEAFLWAEVDDLRGKCTLVEDDHLVVFQLPKITHQDWPSLQVNLTTLSRSDKQAIRTRAVDLSQKRAANQIAAELKRREANKEMTIREQLRLDEEARLRVASVRSFQAASIMHDFQNTNKAQDPCSSKDLNRISFSEEEEGSESGNSSGSHSPKRNLKQKVPPPASAGAGASPASIWTHGEINTKEQVPIRKQATISVGFTPREFPTPSRESTKVEEEQWLKKQAEIRKSCGFSSEDLRPEECDPEWLYEKGMSLMHAGSFVGAVSAFSTGINLAPKMGQLYAGRAQAHLALQNVRKAVEDASEGLNQLQPRVPQNAEQRSQCYRTRATAFRKLGLNQDALTDLKQAEKLDDEDTELKGLINEVTRVADEDYFKDSSDEN